MNVLKIFIINSIFISLLSDPTNLQADEARRGCYLRVRGLGQKYQIIQAYRPRFSNAFINWYTDPHSPDLTEQNILSTSTTILGLIGEGMPSTQIQYDPLREYFPAIGGAEIYTVRMTKAQASKFLISNPEIFAIGFSPHLVPEDFRVADPSTADLTLIRDSVYRVGDDGHGFPFFGEASAQDGVVGLTTRLVVNRKAGALQSLEFYAKSAGESEHPVFFANHFNEDWIDVTDKILPHNIPRPPGMELRFERRVSLLSPNKISIEERRSSSPGIDGPIVVRHQFILEFQGDSLKMTARRQGETHEVRVTAKRNPKQITFNSSPNENPFTSLAKFPGTDIGKRQFGHY